MPNEFLNQKQLSRRWGVSHRTLERWRREGKGPAFHKLEGRVAYRLVDVTGFETARRRTITRAATLVDHVGAA